MESNYNIKQNLCAFKHVMRKMKSQSGEMVDVIILPVAANHIFPGDKGMWVDLTAIALKSPKFSDTHIVKQSLPKEVYEKMTEEERNNTPIFGNMGPWGSKGGAPANEQPDADIDEDLPF